MGRASMSCQAVSFISRAADVDAYRYGLRTGKVEGLPYSTIYNRRKVMGRRLIG